MTDEEQRNLLQRCIAVQMAVTAVAITLVEKRLLTKDDLVQNLDAIGLGTSHARGTKPANDVIETLIARIRAAPVPD